MKKRALSIFLALCMVLTLLPAQVLAEESGGITPPAVGDIEPEIPEEKPEKPPQPEESYGEAYVPLAEAAPVDTSVSGTCGDNLTWTLDNAGTLTISGTGAMADYDYPSNSGWYNHKNKITAVNIQDGVTSIGSEAFVTSYNLTSVTIPDSVTHIGDMAFWECTSLASIEIPNAVSSIGGCAFQGCTALTSVNIPTSMTLLEYSAFWRCSSLTDVYYSGTKTQWDRITIERENDPLLNATIHYNGENGGDTPSSAEIAKLYPENNSIYYFKGAEGDNRMRIFFDREVSCTGTGGRPELDFSVGTLQIHKASNDSVVYQMQYGTEVSSWDLDGRRTGMVLTNASANLDYGTEYYVTMPAGFAKLAGGSVSPAIAKGEWSFRTVANGESHSVTYQLNGGTWDEMIGESWEAGQTVDIPRTLPTKDGYTFGGWSDGTTTYQPGDTFVMADHDVTLTAVWRAKFDYSVTYLLNGGTGDVPAAGYLAGLTVTITNTIPTKEGYIFDGWSDGSTIYQPGNTFEMPTHDVTLTAIWKEAPVLSDHSVTYRLDGGTGSVPAKGYLSGQTVTVITNIPTKEGYAFGGWSDGTTIYRPGDTFVMPDHDVTLTAVWKDFIGPPVPTFTVTYSLDGGVGNLPAEQHKLNETVVIPDVAPKKEGYIFIGWSDGDNIYPANETNKTFKMPNHDVTLTALWEERPTVTYSVEKALAYAQGHWNDGKGACAEFVYNCVKAGGINIEKQTWTGPCLRAICDATGLQMESLLIDARHANKKDNEGVLAAGDVVALWCSTCGLSPHIVICGGYNRRGYATNYAHNSAKNNEPIWFDVSSYGNYRGEHNGHLTVGKVIRLSTLSIDEKRIKTTNIVGDCPIEMAVTINGETLDSRALTSGTLHNRFATMAVSGSGQERKVNISIIGKNISNHDADIEFWGTSKGKMKLTVTHLYDDNSSDVYTFQNISLTEFTTGYIDSMEPYSLVRVVKQDSQEASIENWVAYSGEEITGPTPERVSQDSDSSPDRPNIPPRPDGFDGPSSSRPSGGSGGGVPSVYSISVGKTANGSVTVSPKPAAAHSTVTITVKPDSGYVLDTLTVIDKNGKDVRLNIKGTSKYTFIMPDSKVTVSASFRLDGRTVSSVFSDVPAGYWAKGAIDWASANGYMKGLTGSAFNPEGVATRQQVWMILARLSGQSPSGMAEARIWAMNSGLSDGTKPGAPVTRQQMVTFLHRYCGMRGYPISGNGDLTAFLDYSSASDYAKNALAWAVGNGIVTGTKAGTLNPGGFATRAQFAVVLQRFYEDDFSD